MSSLLLLLLLFRAIDSFRIKRTVSAISNRLKIANIQKMDRKIFEKAQLHFQSSETFNDWWDNLCLAADKFEFSSMTLPVTTRKNKAEILSWQSKLKVDKKLEKSDRMKLTIPIRDRRKGSFPILTVEIRKNGSLENAGRRLALFSRLVHEHDIVSLPENGKEEIAKSS
jgi:hypothetical protein